MTSEPSTISLAPLCRDGDVKKLFEQLTAAKSQPITLDAEDVTTMPSLLLQGILAAEREWQSEDIAFEVINMSDACCQTLTLLGLEDDHFSSEVAA